MTLLDYLLGLGRNPPQEVDRHSRQNIIFQNKKFCCFSFIIAMVHQNSPAVEFWQEKIEGNLRRANTEPSEDFRRTNTEPSVDLRKANTEGRGFLRAGRAAPRDFPRVSTLGIPSEQPCQPSENPVLPSSFNQTTHSISNRFFQCFSYIIDRLHQNSPSMPSRGPIWIQEGQYGFRRANTELSVHFKKAYTELSRHFRRANTETYQKQNVNLSKIFGKNEVFLGLAGLLLGISLRLCHREIPWSSPASAWKTLSFPPLLLRLTHSSENVRFIILRTTTNYLLAYSLLITIIVFLSTFEAQTRDIL